MSTHVPPYRFVVARLDASEDVTDTFEVVESKHRLEGLKMAHQFCRSRSHEDTDFTYAVVELREDGSYLDRVMTAGLARCRLLPTRLYSADHLAVPA